MRYGRSQFGYTGNGLMVTFDGAPEWKAGGITIDPSTITAVSADTTIAGENQLVKNGQKYLRYGQVMCKITTVEVQTVTVASATAGTFTLTLSGSTTAALNYNATATEMQTALEALPNVGSGNVVVSGPAAGVYTVTFGSGLGNLAQMTATDSTTGTGHSVTVATVTSGSATSGMWGPYDPAASDGRQTLTPGQCVILNETWIDTPGGSFAAAALENLGAIEGGRVWKQRVLATSGTHSLAAGPTLAELRTAFPRLMLVDDQF